MASLLEKIKQAREMRDSMKMLKKELDVMSAEYENGGVKVVCRGNMSIESITLTRPDALDPAHPEKFIRLVTDNANKALRSVEAICQKRMMEESKILGMDKFLDT